jgi:hypothetical protein
VPEPQWKVRKPQAIDLADHPDAGRLDHPADHPYQVYLSGSAVRPVGYRHPCWPPWFCWFMRSFDMLSSFFLKITNEQNNGCGVSAFLKTTAKILCKSPCEVSSVSKKRAPAPATLLHSTRFKFFSSFSSNFCNEVCM